LEPFWTALYDDLNVPQAMAAVWDVLRNDSYTPSEKRESLKKAEEILELDLFKSENIHIEHITITCKVKTGNHHVTIGFPESKKDFVFKNKDSIEEIETNRKNAKIDKDYNKADLLRDELKKMNFEVKDMPDGTTMCQYL
jgi:cysteinyl-tRNA synthetase